MLRVPFEEISDNMRKLLPEGYGKVKSAEGPDGKKIHLPTGASDVIKEGFRNKGLGLKKGLGLVVQFEEISDNMRKLLPEGVNIL